MAKETHSHALAAAKAIRALGGWPVPVNGKNPAKNGRGWEKLRLDPDTDPAPFLRTGMTGAGVVLGASGWVDLEADCAAAEMVLGDLAPETGCSWRSPTKRTHRLYVSDAEHVEWELPDAGTLVELRAGNHQSVVPRSLHPDGGEYEWLKQDAPSPADAADLLRAGTLAAVAGAVAAAPRTHVRHRSALALVGFLRRRGVTEREALAVMRAVAHVGGDRNIEDRENCVRDTYQKPDDARITGLPTLADLVGEEVARRIGEWLPGPAAGWEVGGSVGSVGTVARDPTFIWGQPIEFRDLEKPPFPTHALPPWLRDFVLQLAIETQTPPDLAGMLSLAACAVALQKRVIVRPRQGWEEPVNQYVVVALPPAARKSVVFKAVAAPIVAYERERAMEERPTIAQAKAERRLLEQRQKQAERLAVKEGLTGPGTSSEEAVKLAVELDRTFVPMATKMIADDVTPEKLANLIFEQKGRMAILSAEGGIFGIMQGRYSQGAPNIEVFLKGHSGDELRVDRMGRSEEFVSEPTLTIGLAVQPSVIRRVPPEFRERGLMGRCLYSLPFSRIGEREEDAPLMERDVSNLYHRALTSLLELPLLADEPPKVLQYERDAMVRLLAFSKALEPRLHEEKGDLGQMGDWAGKLAGAIVRISGLLHCAKLWEEAEPWQFVIEWQTVEQAIVIGEYLLKHARAAYDQMGADSSIDRGRRIVRWLQREKIAEFTRRDAHRGAMGGDGSVLLLDQALQLLMDHDYIRVGRTKPTGQTGGRPVGVFEVNPHVLGETNKSQIPSDSSDRTDRT